MEGKWSVWYKLITVIFAFSATAIIMFRVDPFKATMLEKSLFYISVSIGILGTIFLIYSIIFKRNF